MDSTPTPRSSVPTISTRASRYRHALLATGTAANPKCIGNNRGCVPYNIFSDGGRDPAQLNYVSHGHQLEKRAIAHDSC